MYENNMGLSIPFSLIYIPPLLSDITEYMRFSGVSSDTFAFATAAAAIRIVDW